MSNPEIAPTTDSTMPDSARPEGIDRVSIPVEFEDNVIAFPVRHEGSNQEPQHLEYDLEHSDNVTELDFNDINLRAAHLAVEDRINELQDLKHREAVRQASLLGDERDRNAEAKSEAAFDNLEQQVAKESLIHALQSKHNESIAGAGRTDVLDLSNSDSLPELPVTDPTLGSRKVQARGSIFDKGRTRRHG